MAADLSQFARQLFSLPGGSDFSFRIRHLEAMATRSDPGSRLPVISFCTGGYEAGVAKTAK
jgi:hypothetical protein